MTTLRQRYDAAVNETPVNEDEVYMTAEDALDRIDELEAQLQAISFLAVGNPAKARYIIDQMPKGKADTI